MSTAATPEASQPALSEPARLINVFFSPSKTFTDLKRKPSWWVPWLLIGVFSVGFAYTVDRKVGYDQVVQNMFKLVPKQAERIDKLPADQKDRVMKSQVMTRKGFSYGAPVTGLIFMVIVAAILMASFNFGAGAEVKFGTSLAIVVYAGLPSIIKTILAMVSLMMPTFDPEGFILQNPAATNPGYFLSDPANSTVLYSFLSGLDIFTIWSLVLTAIGFACVTKLKRGTTFAVVFGWYVVLLLIGTGIAALFA